MSRHLDPSSEPIPMEGLLPCGLESDRVVGRCWLACRGLRGGRCAGGRLSRPGRRWPMPSALVAHRSHGSTWTTRTRGSPVPAGRRHRSRRCALAALRSTTDVRRCSRLPISSDAWAAGGLADRRGSRRRTPLGRPARPHRPAGSRRAGTCGASSAAGTRIVQRRPLRSSASGSTGLRPTATASANDWWTARRDRRCRFPRCRRRVPRCGELDCPALSPGARPARRTSSATARRPPGQASGSWVAARARPGRHPTLHHPHRSRRRHVSPAVLTPSDAAGSS